MRRIAALAGAVLLAGCEPADEAPAAPPTPSQTAAPASAPSPSPAASPSRPGHRLALTANGLSSTEFGASRVAVEALVEASLGRPTGRSSLDECGAGPMEFTDYGAITLSFLEGKFVGWSAERGAKTPTVDGILPGVTRAELERERGVTLIPDSTLDGEFEYAAPDGTMIGGFLEGTGPSALVASLYAGVNCFFR